MKILSINRPFDGPVAVSNHVDLLADSSTVLNGKPLFLPDDGEGFTGSIIPAVRICRLGRSILPKFASRYYADLTLVLRVTPPNNDLIPPSSALAVSFDSALGIGEWMLLQSVENETVTIESSAFANSFQLSLDSLKIDDSIALLSRYFTLKNGDIIIPSLSPFPLFPLQIDTRVTASLNSTQLLDFKIK